MTFDTLIVNATLPDGRTGMGLGIKDGKIAAVEADLAGAEAKERVDASDQLVIPGMIDTHAHVYQYVTGKFGLDADMVGVQSGVTTIIDQGGPSCMTLGGYRHYVSEPAKTRALCFISCYLVGGLEAHIRPHQNRLDFVDGVVVQFTPPDDAGDLFAHRRPGLAQTVFYPLEEFA